MIIPIPFAVSLYLQPIFSGSNNAHDEAAELENEGYEEEDYSPLEYSSEYSNGRSQDDYCTPDNSFEDQSNNNDDKVVDLHSDWDEGSKGMRG